MWSGNQTSCKQANNLTKLGTSLFIASTPMMSVTMPYCKENSVCQSKHIKVQARSWFVNPIGYVGYNSFERTETVYNLYDWQLVLRLLSVMQQHVEIGYLTDCNVIFTRENWFQMGPSSVKLSQNIWSMFCQSPHWYQKVKILLILSSQIFQVMLQSGYLIPTI